MATIDVSSRPVGDGWECAVLVIEGAGRTDHRVTLRRVDLERLAPGASPDQLVRASFEFLLEREPKESILRAFDLPDIGRYFPEFERSISRRLTGG